MSSALILLAAAGNWKFVFLCIFPNTEPEPLGMDGALQEASLNSPSPTPVCEETPVLWPLQLWPDGRVSILTEVEDSERLRLLEQVGSPVMWMEESMRNEA